MNKRIQYPIEWNTDKDFSNMSPFFAYTAIALLLNYTVFGSVHQKATINKWINVPVHCSSTWVQSIIECSSHCAEDAYCVTFFHTISLKCDVCLGSCAVPKPVQVPPGQLIVSPFRDWSQGKLILLIFTVDKIHIYFHFIDYIAFTPSGITKKTFKSYSYIVICIKFAISDENCPKSLIRTMV